MPSASLKAAWYAHLVRVLDKLSTVQAHPDVPVVDNLEDIWLVSKLQEERKAKQKQQERAQQLQQYKQVIKHLGSYSCYNLAVWGSHEP